MNCLTQSARVLAAIERGDIPDDPLGWLLLRAWMRLSGAGTPARGISAPTEDAP